jgi:hypothetical protein
VAPSAVSAPVSGSIAAVVMPAPVAEVNEPM